MRREAAGLNLRGEAVLEAAFEHLYNAMVITDADFGGGPFIQRCNPAFCAMTGYAVAHRRRHVRGQVRRPQPSRRLPLKIWMGSSSERTFALACFPCARPSEIECRQCVAQSRQVTLRPHHREVRPDDRCPRGAPVQPFG